LNESLQTSAVRALEAVLNRALALDPGTGRSLAALAGKHLEIACTLPPITLAAGFTPDGQLTLTSEPGEFDLRLTGTALALVTLALDSSDRVSFVGTGVEVSGDNDFLRQLRAVLRNLDIDWEDALATLIGDLPAHLIVVPLRRANRWRRDAQFRAFSGLAEFAREEARLTPTRTEMEKLTTNIRHLNLDVDRIAARIHKLRTQLQAPEPR